MTLQDIATYISAAAAVVCAVYTGLSYHRPKSTAVGKSAKLDVFRPSRGWSPVLPIILILLGWGAVLFAYFVVPELPAAEFDEYGLYAAATYGSVVSFHKWKDYRTYKGILITRVIHSERDRMEDDWIAKSIPYTIDQESLAMMTFDDNKMRYNQKGYMTIIEYDFVVLPQDKSPEQVRKLADVTSLGGHILVSVAQGLK